MGVTDLDQNSIEDNNNDVNLQEIDDYYNEGCIEEESDTMQNSRNYNKRNSLSYKKHTNHILVAARNEQTNTGYKSNKWGATNG